MARDMTTSGPTLQSPAWAGDYMSRDHLVPGPFKVLASEFRAPDAVKVDVGAAGAVQGATSVPVEALSGPIPNGTVLDFGTNKFARLTAAAATGATSLTVTALVTALVDADVAWYPGAGTLKVSVPSGTVVGRTIAERDAETPFGLADAADDETFILAFDIDDVNRNNDAVMYRPGSQVFEDKLPGWSGLAAGVQADVRAKYLCTISRD